MRWFVASLFGALVLSSLPSLSAQDQGGQEKKRLFFRVRNNQEFHYRVSLAAQRSAREDDEQRSGKSGQQKEEERDRERERKQESGQAMQATDLEYHLRVTDTSGGENTFEVLAGRAGAQAREGKASRQGDDDGEERSGGGGKQKSQQQAAGLQKFTVKVGQDGEVKSITPDSSASSSRGEGQTLTEHQVRHHLEVLLGSGLHRTELEPGRSYALSSAKEGGFPESQGGQQGSDREKQEREKPERERERQQDQERREREQQARSGQGSGSRLMAVSTRLLKRMLLRFEGFTKQEDREVARFSLAAVARPEGRIPASGLQENRPNQEERRPQDGQEPERPGFPLDESDVERMELKSVGSALYLAEDGLLQRFSGDCQVSPRDRTQKNQTPMSFRFQIRRMETGGATEKQERKEER